MKKERLLKQLENVKVPELVIAGHKAMLKSVLMEGSQLKEYSRKVNSGRNIGSIFRTFKDWLTGPVWRPALASALTLVLIGAILGVVFYIAAPSPAVLAADIVKKDPGIQQRLSGTGEIIIVKVEIRDKIASVVCGRSMGDFIEADVDMDGHSVVHTRRFEALFIPEISMEAQDSAILIARQEPGAKAMLDKGATIGRVFPVFSAISNITIENGNLVKVTPEASQAIVPIYLDGKARLVQVNLESKTIEKVIEPQSGSSFYLDMYYIFQQS
jgi:hypothetical protein